MQTTQSNGHAPSSNGQNNGRDSRGRFTTGNAGGSGNPFARQCAAFRARLCQVVTEEDIEEAARQLVARARAGELAAIKLLFAYVIGKPTEAPDPDTLDTQEWRQFQEAAVLPAQLPPVMGGMSVQTACALAREVQPIVAREMGQKLAEALVNGNETVPPLDPALAAEVRLWGEEENDTPEATPSLPPAEEQPRKKERRHMGNRTRGQTARRPRVRIPSSNGSNGHEHQQVEPSTDGSNGRRTEWMDGSGRKKKGGAERAGPRRRPRSREGDHR
jgi:hypothetical protein